MTLEQRGEHTQPLPLTASQERAVRFVTDSLEDPDRPRALIVLNGFSGVGKTTVLEAVKDRIAHHNGLVIDSVHDIKGQYARPGHLLIATIPHETNTARKTAKEEAVSVPDRVWEQHTVAGMTPEEAAAYVQTLNLSDSTLSPQQVAKYSLGIPLLAQMLTRPGLTEPMAARVAAGFFGRNFMTRYLNTRLQADTEQNYLRMPVPSDVVLAMGEYSAYFKRQTIYTKLETALEEQAEARKKGIIEESPLFLAPESEGIYTAMLRIPRHQRSFIDIFAPDISGEDLARVQQAFGYDPNGRGYYEPYDATRPAMFHADYRKTQFWHIDAEGGEHEDTRLDDYFIPAARKAISAYRNGKLGLPFSGKDKLISFAMHSHEHEGKGFHTAYNGWMVESLLQHRDIPYFVDNWTHDSSYVYNPETKHIEMLPKRVSMRY